MDGSDVNIPASERREERGRRGEERGEVERGKDRRRRGEEEQKKKEKRKGHKGLSGWRRKEKVKEGKKMEGLGRNGVLVCVRVCVFSPSGFYVTD